MFNVKSVTVFGNLYNLLFIGKKTIKRAIHPLQCLWTETQVERRFDLKKIILYVLSLVGILSFLIYSPYIL
jgi:hypothetical protein